MLMASESDLLKACSVLFGSGTDLGRDFLYYLQPSGIKTAYRRRALLTHPDTAAHREGQSDSLTEQFIEASNAYEQLLGFVLNRDRVRLVPGTEKPAPRPAQHRRQHAGRVHTPPRREHASGIYCGSVPKRSLLFGQYLFYTGEVQWEALIRAIIWQRRQRPRIGDIALRQGLLDERQVKDVLDARKLGEHTGEAAMRLRYLSRAQLHYLILHQRRQQLPFGEFFVRENLISRPRLFRVLSEFNAHNHIYTDKGQPFS